MRNSRTFMLLPSSGKPLSLIAGKPMIQHVYERACQAKLPDEVVVATDNELVKKAVDALAAKQ